MEIPRFSLIASLLAMSAIAYADTDAPLPREVENEQILGINKEAPHATLMPYATLEQALGGRRR